MASHQGLLYLVLFFILAGFGSSSTFISYDAFECHGLMGRNLLQAKSSCSLDFENQNYTILTSRCKGPNYPINVCCEALREFSCPFSNEINDMKSDCATTMFSYIHIYGRYPPGLFSNMCRGDKNGLVCDDNNLNKNAAASTITLALISSTTLLQLLVIFLHFHLL